jgi:hypothetical protein
LIDDGEHGDCGDNDSDECSSEYEDDVDDSGEVKKLEPG